MRRDSAGEPLGSLCPWPELFAPAEQRYKLLLKRWISRLAISGVRGSHSMNTESCMAMRPGSTVEA